jgi:DNA-3-methyladenine glycosylase II
MTTEQLELVPLGSFSLRAAAEFGFGPNEGRMPAFDGAMRLAFGVDGGRGYAGAVLRQREPDGPVGVELQTIGDPDPQLALNQIARVISLDHDGRQFAAVGEREPRIGELQRAHPGQRPVLFYSPYEAASWSIISARRSAPQAARTREAVAQRLGASFELDGSTLHAFPQPDALRALTEPEPGLGAEKVARLQALADEALNGRLEAERLRQLGSEGAYTELQRFRGLGPFYAGLVVLRACGFADAALPMAEPKLLARTAELYGLERPPTLERFNEIAEAWRPFRTWTSVLIRLAGDRAR